MTLTLENIIEAATARLTSRQHYAAAVLCGAQRWSGADLMGKAKKYGASYAAQRGHAGLALRRAGGCVVAIENGLLVTGVRVGQDDFGDAIFSTERGPRVQKTASRATAPKA